jgi:hypothetical protein
MTADLSVVDEALRPWTAEKKMISLNSVYPSRFLIYYTIERLETA